MIGGGAECGKDPHRLVFPAAPGRCEQVAQLTDGGLEQHGRQPVVFGDVLACADSRSGTVAHQLNRRHGENVAGDHSRRHRNRNGLGVFGFQIDLDVVRLSIGRGNDVIDHSNDHAVIFDVGFLREPVADINQIGDHAHVVIEPARRLGQHPNGEQR